MAMEKNRSCNVQGFSAHIDPFSFSPELHLLLVRGKIQVHDVIAAVFHNPKVSSVFKSHDYNDSCYGIAMFQHAGEWLGS